MKNKKEEGDYFSSKPLLYSSTDNILLTISMTICLQFNRSSYFSVFVIAYFNPAILPVCLFLCESESHINAVAILFFARVDTQTNR